MDMNVTMKDPKKSDYYYEESIKTLRTNIPVSYTHLTLPTIA